MNSSWLAIALAVLGAAACGAAGDYAGEDDAGEDDGDVEESADGAELGVLESAVRGGTEGGGVGTVEIGHCSGTVVGRHMILTASHCFDDELDGWEGDVVSRKISYAAGGRSWRCMTGSPANGKCNNAADVWAIRMKNDDAVNDFAVVFTLTPGGEFQNIDASDRASNLYTGSLSSSEKYTFYGRGPDHYDGSGSGVMRYMNDSLNWRGAGHFITDADGVRPCIGDSGGPYYLRGMRSIFGVLSEADSSGQCAKVGGKIAGARLTERVVERINEYRDGEGIQRCTRMSFAPDFWTCR